MNHEEASDLLRRYQDAMNQHNVGGLTALYAEDATLLSPIFKTVRGRAAIERSFRALFKMFPDYQVHSSDSLFICEGARAAAFSTTTATHGAELFGLPPTGHRIEYQSARLFTFRDGQILHERRIYDFVGLLDRLEKVRLDRELTAAAEIQRTLLPRTHHAGEFFEAVGASLPCRAIGGDFFEYVDLPSNAFGIALGDVSGKGPAAALVAAMLQGIVSVEAEAGQCPSVLLSRMNRALIRRGIRAQYATLVYGVLSRDGHFTYSNAGHNPPVLVTEGGVRRLSTGGPMLGVFDNANFPEETVSLSAGDSLVTFTDGVTEAFGVDADEFGEERLVTCARTHRLLPPADLLERMLAAVKEFSSDKPQSDDVTMTVVRYR